MIRSAYHCSDEEVLDTRIGRLVQMINVLNVADDVRRMELEWQAKLVASVTANTIEDENARKKLIKSIQGMNLRGVDPDAEDEPGYSPADTPGDERSIEDIVEHGSVQQALARNLRRKGPGIFGMG